MAQRGHQRQDPVEPAEPPAPEAPAPAAPAQQNAAPPPRQAPHNQQQVPQNAPVALEQQAAPVAPVAPPPPLAQNPIPSMNNPLFAKNFGRMDCLWTPVQHTMSIANQDTLSGYVHDQLQQISSTALEINRENFIRMWKTLILKRTQDIFESQRKVRPDNFIRLSRTIMMPAPLADLLYSLGSFFSTETGFYHQIIPPTRPAAPPGWWTVDAAILDQWELMINRMQGHYVMKEYPSQRETIGRPITLVIKRFTEPLTQVRAFTNEPKLSDAFIALCNNTLFAEQADFPIGDAALNMTPPLLASTIRGKYVASYITEPEL